MSVCLHFSISLLNESVAHIFLVLTGFLTLIDLLSIYYSLREIILALIFYWCKQSLKTFHLLLLIWGQSYNFFYTLGQILKRILKQENSTLTKNMLDHNFRTLHFNIFEGLHFYSGLKRQIRNFILHHPKV